MLWIQCRPIPVIEDHNAMPSNNIIKKNIAYFGFKTKSGSTHLARTIMLEDLEVLLAHVDDPKAEKAAYIRAIEKENCLGKRSGITRALTTKHLTTLYGLDPTIPLFKVLLFFWRRDCEGHPLLALLCAHARDRLLQISAPFILKLNEGTPIFREELETYIENVAPDRFSDATLTSLAQNINASWTKSGHLKGRVKKIRVRARPTPGAVAYALFLGYLGGHRGPSLFQSEYARLLDCTVEHAMELAEQASQKGWIVFKRIGDVMEVQFPHLLNQTDMERIREQS